MRVLKNGVQRASDRLLGLLAPKATAQAQPGQWCVTHYISCGWPKVWYEDVVKGVSCGCW
jgi:hypothetical protein